MSDTVSVGSHGGGGGSHGGHSYLYRSKSVVVIGSPTPSLQSKRSVATHNSKRAFHNPPPQELEQGWDNHATIGRKSTAAKKYGYAPHALLKQQDLLSELKTLAGLSDQIERERVHFLNQPKPMPAYFSIAAALGLIHHEGTDVGLELEVVKRIIARESLLLKLENLCRRLVKLEALQRTTTAVENELLLTLAEVRTHGRGFWFFGFGMPSSPLLAPVTLQNKTYHNRCATARWTTSKPSGRGGSRRWTTTPRTRAASSGKGATTR
jgi:hypothetical protein